MEAMGPVFGRAELLRIAEAVAQEKGISPTEVIEAMEQAIGTAARRKYGQELEIRAEIDRYISWPGQALAYKLGELRIRGMRQEAESLLGDRFDLRQFHDVLLANGALPMAMLEAQVARYIDEKLTDDSATSR